MAVNAATLRVMVDCEPAILREVVGLALAGLPGVVLLGSSSDDADLVVVSRPRNELGGRPQLALNDAGGLGQLVDSIRRFVEQKVRLDGSALSGVQDR